MLQDLSSEVTCIHTIEAALVEFWPVVIDVLDVDLHMHCGVRKHSMDILLGLSSLRFNKLA